MSNEGKQESGLESEKKPAQGPRRKRNQHPDRFYAEPKVLDRIRTWLDQAMEHFQGGVKPTRNDLVNIVLMSHAERLSEDELKQVWERCFSPVKFMKAATRRLEEALERGENVTLESVMESLRAQSLPEIKRAGRPRGSRSKATAQSGDADVPMDGRGDAPHASPIVTQSM